MKEQKSAYGDVFFVPEFQDVLDAKNLGNDYIVNDWPFGSRKKCVMHFSVESNNRGQRLVKQSTLDGRSYKPKKSTYSEQCKIVEIFGKVGDINYSKNGVMVIINIQDSKYSSQSFFDDEAKQLYHKFFKD